MKGIESERSDDLIRLERYAESEYADDVERNGLDETWRRMMEMVGNSNDPKGLVQSFDFGELYETGLVLVDAEAKKNSGKYFTPKDVAVVMADWLKGLKGSNVCDVCCGTGNLILTYLERIGNEEATNLLESGRVFLYDVDPTATFICRSLIGILYGEKAKRAVNANVGDFLDDSVVLPFDCKAISNPPYAKIRNLKETYPTNEVAARTGELYAAFLSKILTSSDASVVVAPQSFLGGRKFDLLRKEMNERNGFVVAFDNVPGSLFVGSGTGSKNKSVRSAIVVTENEPNSNGYRCSGLIRFGTSERGKVVDADFLKRALGRVRRTTENGERFAKVFPEFEETFERWTRTDGRLEDLMTKDSEHALWIPTTCRYYFVATRNEPKRDGKRKICFKDERAEILAYGAMNSSLCYWFWRVCDGGFTFPLSLLVETPFSESLVPKEDEKRFESLVREMMENERKFLSYKKNAGRVQETTKFPKRYRDELNEILLKGIGSNLPASAFDAIHANSISSFESAFERNE